MRSEEGKLQSGINDQPSRGDAVNLMIEYQHLSHHGSTSAFAPAERAVSGNMGNSEKWCKRI
jgi:hypothetical protein